MEKEIRFSVRFPPEVLDHIKHVAKEEERSINSEIIWILREYLKERQQHASDHKNQA
ncbi:hypothetical protein KDH_11430 [Dictyobacter sp. S3.2.2.5]|uniref:Arc-like DNA binding domain-containing protein n=1 Tax=Dictyobacter halimunensis TaxID=3026934 RepID=A0ABQ6FJF7_9CHLR|nr:hypothetical protein KDH_11430 [Dictyobacter sp. S3.2.2.5]